jgi:hypothetical protein
LWYLHSESELEQDGDTGGTVASEQHSDRYGIEWANYYKPVEHLAFDLDLADSIARFTAPDPADAAPVTPGSTTFGPGGTRAWFFGESAAALFRTARLDFGRVVSIEINAFAERGSRVSNQPDVANFRRILESA